jgi:hypothetical protein
MVAPETARMAKIQRAFYVSEDLDWLLDAYQEATGVSFTRLMTAAIVGYLFDGLEHADSSVDVGPDQRWMRIASKLERNEILIEDVPVEIVKDVIASAKGLHGFSQNETTKKEMERRVERAELVKHTLQKAAKALGRRPMIVELTKFPSSLDSWSRGTLGASAPTTAPPRPEPDL